METPFAPVAISIHALREEGDRYEKLHRVTIQYISIHALREEGDLSFLLTGTAAVVFLSTPSARRATRQRSDSAGSWIISIHALREEGDAATAAAETSKSNFYPRPPRGGRLCPPAGVIFLQRFLSTPSARRATWHPHTGCGSSWGFLSTPSARRATRISEIRAEVSPYFYPRPPRGGRHKNVIFYSCFQGISIHALREEGDPSASSPR